MVAIKQLGVAAAAVLGLAGQGLTLGFDGVVDDIELAERAELDIGARGFPPSRPVHGFGRRAGSNILTRPRDRATRRGGHVTSSYSHRPRETEPHSRSHRFLGSKKRRGGLKLRSEPSTPKGKGKPPPSPKASPKKKDTQDHLTALNALSIGRRIGLRRRSEPSTPKGKGRPPPSPKASPKKKDSQDALTALNALSIGRRIG
ncbi:unnamed protein product [Clonostachys rhizophaga]|uniref:Uncharacterized protein n=1 Tax=Clonostachys rhizophaga TaxID=160324 RepID=A0A9N9YW50_9HYPO|nr:unnamed protein product [Clonostachys rhizophaga]